MGKRGRPPKVKKVAEIEKEVPRNETQVVNDNPALWITVKFSDGAKYKIPAHTVAREIANIIVKDQGIDPLKVDGIMKDALKDHQSLLIFCNNNDLWAKVRNNAIKFQPEKLPDYVTEWKDAEKGIITDL